MPEKGPGERERSGPICARGCRHCPWYQEVCQRLCACQRQRTHPCKEIREFTCTQCVSHTQIRSQTQVQTFARAHTGELAKGSDRESLHALIDLKFDPVPRVVEAVVASISKIVAGRAQDNGTLASFVGISPAANSRHAAHSKIAAIYMCMLAHMHTMLINTCAVMFVHTQIDAYKCVCTHTQAFAIGN